MAEGAPAAGTPAPVANGAAGANGVAPPTNGAASRVQAAGQPQGNGAPVRGPDGKFAPAKANGEAKAPEAPKPAPSPETYEVVVNGQKRKLTLEQIIARAQKAEGSEAKFQEAAELRSKAEALLKELEEDPEAVLVKTGHDPEKFLAKYVEKRAKEAALTPEEREFQRVAKERDDYKAKAEAAEREKREAAQRIADEKTFARLESTLLAKAKEYGLEQSPKTLELLCNKALEAVELGYEPTADQLCQDILDEEKQRMASWKSKVLASMTPEQLIEELGPERFAAMQKASLAKVPGPGQGRARHTEDAPKSAPKPLGTAEFLKKWRR